MRLDKLNVLRQKGGNRMSEKVMIDIYFTYGKGDGDKLYERFIINDTAKERQEVLDEISLL